MTNPRTDKSPWIAILLCVVALLSGCQADKDGQRELLINELRLHEDTIYDQEADLEELERRLDAAHRENTILKQEIATLQTQIPQQKKVNSTDRLRNKIFGDPVLNPAQNPPDTPLTDAPPFSGPATMPKTEPPPRIDIQTEPNGSSNDHLNPAPTRDSTPQLAPPPPDPIKQGEKLKFRPTSHRTTSYKPTLFESQRNDNLASENSTDSLRACFSKKSIVRTKLDDATALVQNDSLKYRRAIQNDPPPSDASENYIGQSDAVQNDVTSDEPMMRSVMQKNSVMQSNHSAQNQSNRQNGNLYQNQPREPRRLPQSQNQRSLQPSQAQQFSDQRIAQQPKQNRSVSQQFSQQQPQQRTARASHNQNPGQVAGSIPAPLDAALGNLPPAIKAPASAVHHITINPRLTGGHNADKKPGDEGIMVVFSPQDDKNRPLFVQGDISVVLLDTKLQARSARWDFSSDEAVKFFRKSVFGGEAYHLELRWPNLPPPNPQQEVFVRFTTGTGQKFEASRTFLVEARIEGDLPSFATQSLPGQPMLQPTPAAPQSTQQNSSDLAPPAFNINIPDVTQPNQIARESTSDHSGSSARDRLSRRSGIGQRFSGSRFSRRNSSQPSIDGAEDSNVDPLDVHINGMPNGGPASNQPLYADGVRNNSTSSGSTWWNPLSWFPKPANATSAHASNAPSYQNQNSMAPQSGFTIVPLDGSSAPHANVIGPTIAGTPINSNGQTGNSTNESLAPRWSGNAPSATMIPSSSALATPQMAERPEWRPYR